MEQNLTTIKVNFIYNLFDGKDGYCIYIYRDCATAKKLKCIGNYLPTNKNFSYEMQGCYKENEKYGLNFMVQSFNEIIEHTKEGICAYLSSIDGIGKVLSERIYDAFGDKILDVLENNPESILNYGIKGITQKKYDKILKSYREKFVLKDLINFLLPFGLTIKQITSLYNKGVKSVDDIHDNPYSVCNVFGVNISTADAIAKKVNFPETHPLRIKAHAKSVLYDAENCGHTGVEANEYGLRLIRSLACPAFTKENICGYIIGLIKERVLTHNKIIVDGKEITYIYLRGSFNTESNIAINAVTISQCTQKTVVKSKLEGLCRKNGLDNEQSISCETILNSSFSALTGGPGVGKTTTIKTIADYISKYEKSRVVFMAPSGRAARRITESTGYPASTIHSALSLKPNENWHFKDDDEKEYFTDCTVIIDEFSMVDIHIADYLLSAIKPGCRVVLVGDVNQLQSVGPGAVFRDIINSDTIPVVRLNKVYRQSASSHIYINAQNVVNGVHELEAGDDFTIIHTQNPQEAQDKIIESFVYYTNKVGLENIYCLCPCKEREAGVKNVNSALQEKINPLKPNGKEFKGINYSFRIGDPVMHLVNNSDVSNGDIGYVSFIGEDEGDKFMQVTYFGDTIVEYNSDNISDVTLAYAFTVHKAQGSENSIVITYISKSIGSRMLKRNLLNTAISRGKDKVILIDTSDNATDMAIDNDDSSERKTALKYHMERQFGGRFVKIM